MSLFRKREQPENPEPIVASPSPPEPKPAPKAQKAEETDSLFFPIQPDPPGTPRQRSFISNRQMTLMRMQIQIADNLRQKFLAPDRSLDLPLERTPEQEQLALEKLQQLTGSSGFRMPAGVPKEEFIANVMNETFGFGPIQPLIDRDDLTEIMVNGPYIIFVGTPVIGH